ncbi:MAG: hypothetical protein LC798_05565 [Chloroflexi bacterium]|nr:hypothetical protein [Chloroflexota bacterium]
MTISASEHARLLIAESLRLFASGLEQEVAEEFDEQLTEAMESGHAAEIISMLACTAGEAWTRYAMAIGEPAPKVLRLVFENWEEAESGFRAGGLAAATP